MSNYWLKQIQMEDEQRLNDIMDTRLEKLKQECYLIIEGCLKEELMTMHMKQEDQLI
jgi:hypothetical protein